MYNNTVLCTCQLKSSMFFTFLVLYIELKFEMWYIQYRKEEKAL
nr:MAG TPA: hypothetical protein [Bacteriophage sp.]